MNRFDPRILIPLTIHVNVLGCTVDADGSTFADGSPVGAFMREELTGFIGYADLRIVAPLICHGWLA